MLWVVSYMYVQFLACMQSSLICTFARDELWLWIHAKIGCMYVILSHGIMRTVVCMHVRTHNTLPNERQLWMCYTFCTLWLIYDNRKCIFEHKPVCVCVFLCVYIYTYMCVCTYMYVFMHTYLNTDAWQQQRLFQHEFVCMFVCMHLCGHTHIHVYIYTYLSTHTHIRTKIHTCIRDIEAYFMHIHIHARHTHTCMVMGKYTYVCACCWRIQPLSHTRTISAMISCACSSVVIFSRTVYVYLYVCMCIYVWVTGSWPACGVFSLTSVAFFVDSMDGLGRWDAFLTSFPFCVCVCMYLYQ